MPLQILSAVACACSAPGGLALDLQRGHNVLAYDVRDEQGILDTDWQTQVTVALPGRPAIRFTMPLPAGTTEDAIAVMVADEVEQQVGPNVVTVEHVTDGPDRIVVAGGASIRATVARA